MRVIEFDVRASGDIFETWRLVVEDDDLEGDEMEAFLMEHISDGNFIRQHTDNEDDRELIDWASIEEMTMRRQAERADS